MLCSSAGFLLASPSHCSHCPEPTASHPAFPQHSALQQGSSWPPRAPVITMGIRSTPLGPAPHGHGSGKPHPQPSPLSSCFQLWGSPMGLLDAHQAPRVGWGQCGPLGSGSWTLGEVHPSWLLGQPVLRGSQGASQKVPAGRSTRCLKHGWLGHASLF